MEIHIDRILEEAVLVSQGTYFSLDMSCSLLQVQFNQAPVLHNEVILTHENICVWQHEAFVSENVYNQLLLGFRKKDTMLGNQ